MSCNNDGAGDDGSGDDDDDGSDDMDKIDVNDRRDGVINNGVA